MRGTNTVIADGGAPAVDARWFSQRVSIFRRDEKKKRQKTTRTARVGFVFFFQIIVAIWTGRRRDVCMQFTGYR